ncbi:MAG TPA: glycerol-3-phosphate dehydrogenase, partial [Pyrinomonadaceae bacterium]|nr:glycerol-3-phosphate dehydrogenase [Pyrinomonadaceae bacterium]
MTSEVSHTEFDVIVIGAGINGAGIARDASMRGLRVLLLDKGDIGGGTSSYSTRLIHGGLRYLEHGELRLVRESLRERSSLLRIAPHLVRPLQLLVPLYEQARRGPWAVRAGLIAYDLLSFDRDLPRHHMLSRAKTLLQAPALNPEGLLGAAVFFDAQVEFAERLVLENVLSAIEHGATVYTYAKVEKLLIDEGTVRGMEFMLAHQGSSPTVDRGSSPTVREGSSDQRFTVSANVVINAAGPWVDQVLGRIAADSPRLIGGTKGSHIIVASFAGAPETAIYVEAKTDQRPFFIIPWDHKYLIGTTDIRYDGNPDQVLIDRSEIDYLLRETNRVIPQAKLTPEKILYSYSGVRPLPFISDEDEPGITRRHFLRSHPQVNNLFSVVGGKLTTYRNLAEAAVHLVFRSLRRASPPCITAREPLPGAATSPDQLAYGNAFTQRSRLSTKTNSRLLGIYGARALLLLDLLDQHPELGKIFDVETGAIAAEVVFAFRRELAQTLSDCLLRRTMVGL